jgi:RNA polymerase sigma-70 factor (ECF subfamily)
MRPHRRHPSPDTRARLHNPFWQGQRRRRRQKNRNPREASEEVGFLHWLRTSPRVAGVFFMLRRFMSTQPPPSSHSSPSSTPGARRQAKKDLLRSTIIGGVSDGSDLDRTVNLIDRVRKNDSGAADELALRYRDKLVRYLRVRMSAGDRRNFDTDDIFQEVQVRMFENLEHFEYRGKGSLYAYLKAIAENILRGEARSPSAYGRVSGETAELILNNAKDSNRLPEDDLQSAELRRILDETAAELPDKFREVILYRFYLEAPSKEVAEWMGYDDPHAVDVLYSRARMKWMERAEPRLRDWLEGD